MFPVFHPEAATTGAATAEAATIQAVPETAAPPVPEAIQNPPEP